MTKLTKLEAYEFFCKNYAVISKSYFIQQCKTNKKIVDFLKKNKIIILDQRKKL